jgi:hypothetical protein
VIRCAALTAATLASALAHSVSLTRIAGLASRVNARASSLWSHTDSTAPNATAPNAAPTSAVVHAPLSAGSWRSTVETT